MPTTNLSLNIQTMSSREIADLTNKEHKNVMADIRNMCESLNIQSAEFAENYKDDKGRTYPCFNLPLHLALTLVTGYNTASRAHVIDKIFDTSKDTNKLLEAIRNFDMSSVPPDMYLYVMQDPETRDIKIGISKDPLRRLKEVNIGNSRHLELVYVKKADNRYGDETAAHKLASEHHLRSEWFTEQALEMVTKEVA